jgi:hypothetical protein
MNYALTKKIDELNAQIKESDDRFYGFHVDEMDAQSAMKKENQIHAALRTELYNLLEAEDKRIFLLTGR